MNEKLSVIVPIYNGATFIDKCLTSLVNQSYDDLEILCINDGSTDKSSEIIKKYAEKDNRIILIEQENIGVSATRNKGLKMASGKYITFCDQDDYIDLNMYKEMISVMESENSDISICGIEAVYPDKIIVRSLDNIDNKYEFMREGILIACVWNKVFRKSIIEEFNLQFLPNMQIGEDLDFAFRYLVCADAVSYVDKPFYKYINHGGNNINDSNKRISIFYCLKSMFDFVENNVKDNKQYQKYIEILNKLFRQHAVDYAFCSLPGKRRKKVAKKIKFLTGKKQINLDKDTRIYFERAFFKYVHPKIYNFLNIFKVK